jgi:hypothetical protein
MQKRRVGKQPRERRRFKAVEIDTTIERRNIPVEKVAHESFEEKRLSLRIDAAAREANGYEVIDQSSR